MGEGAVREAFAKQAAICTAAGAPFTGRVCGLVGARLDRSGSIGRRVLDWPGNPSHEGDALPLRFCGGLHDLARSGVDQQMIDLLGGPPDLVLSDMAHNTVGHRQTDHLKIIALIEIAADFAIRTLRPGGAFVSKNFQGGDAGGVLARLRAEFETVKYVKPASSRKDSAEVFLVALNKR